MIWGNMKKWLNEAVYSISRLRRECNKQVNDNVIEIWSKFWEVSPHPCANIWLWDTRKYNEIFNACVIQSTVVNRVSLLATVSFSVDRRAIMSSHVQHSALEELIHTISKTLTIKLFGTLLLLPQLVYK